MNLTNIASKQHKCRILKASSSQNQILHPPQSIINNEKDGVWISGEGLPQQIILSLEDVQFQYQYISAVVFTCMHDYQTNPKIVQIWIAKNREAMDNGEFIFWDKVEMRKKRGRQMFSVSDIPQSQRIIKFIITETYGQYQTYLNQVMLLAEPDHQTSQSLFNNEDWQRIPKSSQISQADKKAMKKSHTVQNILHQKQSGYKYKQDDHDYRHDNEQEIQNSPLQLLKDVQNFEENKNRKKGRKLELDDMQDPIHDYNDNSLERNTALLSMLKNIVIMEDNLSELTRKVDVLDKKVEYTYENLEGNIMKRVQEIIDTKIQRKLSQKQLDVDHQPRRQRSCKDLTTSRTMNRITGSRAQGRETEKQRQSGKQREMRQKQKLKNRRKYEQSYNNREMEQRQKQRKVMSLVSQLNNKLKQRTRLANKLQKRLKINNKPKSQYYD